MAKITQGSLPFRLSGEFFIGNDSGHLYRRMIGGNFLNLTTGEYQTNPLKMKPCIVGEVYQLEVDK